MARLRSEHTRARIDAARGGPSPDARRAEQDSLALADDLAPLLDALGIQYNRANGGQKLTSPCPSPLHIDRSPSWFVNNDPNDERFGTHACQACGYRGGPAHLAYSCENGTGDWAEAATLLRELFTPVAGQEGIDRLLDRNVARRVRHGPYRGIDLDALGLVPVCDTEGEDYLADRGLEPWMQALLGVRWAPEGTLLERPEQRPLDFSRRVVFPVASGGAVDTFAARAVDPKVKPKYLYPPAPRDSAVWGFDVWSPVGADRIIIGEGALTCWAAGYLAGSPAFGVLGSRLLPGQAVRLRMAKCVVLLPDPDDAGEKLVTDALARLPSVSDLRVARLPRDGLKRDAADALRPRSDRKWLDPDIVRRAVDNAEDARAARPFTVPVKYGARLQVRMT